MPPLPAPDALDPRSRALATIYAPRILKPRKSFTRTPQSRMLDDLPIPIKPSISPFHPLPAIGQKFEEKHKTNVIVFDLNNDRIARVSKLHDVLQTPPSSQGYRKKSLEPLKKSPSHMDQPQHLIRENTYDVIEPVYINAAKVKKRDRSLNRRSREIDGKLSATPEEKYQEETQINVSPKTRFKKAAMKVVKLSTMPETGKLLCLRERQTFTFCKDDEDKLCSLQEIPRSPTQKLTKLSEIFQCLDTKGRHRDRMKKENSWF